MIEAVIFDMDGLLINSEPFWRQAEVEVFSSVNLKLTESMCHDTMGLRIDEVVAHWYQTQPWNTPPSLKDIENSILEKVMLLIKTSGKPLPGVLEAISFFKQKKIKLAIASSSPMFLIEAVVEKLQIAQNFELLHSAQFESYGKPHPAVFLTTANKLGVPPRKCLVFEDSIAGVVAAKAAQMKCIAVPETALFNNPKYVLADLKLKSLLDFIPI